MSFYRLCRYFSECFRRNTYPLEDAPVSALMKIPIRHFLLQEERTSQCTCKYSVIDACWRLEANKRIAVSLSFYWLRVALGLIEPSRNWQCYRLFLEDKGGQYSYIQLQLLGDENESRQPLHQDHMMQQKLIKEGHWEGSRGMFCPLLPSNQKSVSLSHWSILVLPEGLMGCSSDRWDKEDGFTV